MLLFLFSPTVCDKTLLETKRLKKGTCLELYELQDADLKPENVIILTAKNKKRTLQKKSKLNPMFFYTSFVTQN